MTKMLKYLFAFLLFLTATSVYAQGGAVIWPSGHVNSLEPVSGAIGAISTDTPILVRYVGATGTGKVAVASNGDLTFIDGAEGSEAANTDFECPVSGALGGVIDVSDSACDTLGEVVDTINGTCTGCAGTSSKWRAVILDGMRSDSSNDTLATLSSTAAAKNAGLALLADNTVSFYNTIALTPYRDMLPYLENRNFQIVANPYVGQRASLLTATATSTYGSGTSSYAIYSCLEKLSTSSSFAGSETCTTLYTTAAGASTTAATFSYLPGGLYGRKDEKLLVRVLNSAAMTAVVHYAYGGSWFYR